MRSPFVAPSRFARASKPSELAGDRPSRLFAWRAGVVHGVLACAVFALFGCAPRPRMCVAPRDCGDKAACVAGRCQAGGGVPVIDSARRVVVTPVDAAFVRRGDPAAQTPDVVTLGRRSDGDSLLYLRFAADIPRDAQIVEAYLLLDRDPSIDEGTPSADRGDTTIALHAARVVDPWTSGSLSWARQPRIEEVRSPSTPILGARPIVRVDVRELVRRWMQRDRRDQGLVVMADGASTTGVPLTLFPHPTLARPADAKGEGAAEPTSAGGPRLELYLK